MLLHDVQDAGQLHEQVVCALKVCKGCVRMAARVCVDLTHELEDGRQCVCSVHVVVHRLDELLLILLEGCQCLGFLCGRGLALCLGNTEFQVVACLVQTLERRLVHLERLLGVVERGAIVCGQHEHTDGLVAVLLSRVAYHEEIALGLRHLLVVDGQEAIVQPVMCKGAAICALGLCNLVLVVREGQVKTARVNVDRGSEVLVDHRRALDVPARTAFAPGCLPRRLTRLCSLPDCEVHRIFLDLADRDTRTGLQIFERLVRQLAVLGEGLGAEVNVTVLGNVCVTLVDQSLDDVDDGIHGLGCTRMYGCALDAQTLCVDKVLLNIAVSDDVVGHAFLVCLVDDLIVNVGKVLYKGYLVAAVLEVTAEQIEHDERTCVADVEIVIDGRAARVHLDFARGNRYKLLFLTGQCIKQLHGYQSPLSSMSICEICSGVRIQRVQLVIKSGSFTSKCAQVPGSIREKSRSSHRYHPFSPVKRARCSR